MPEFSSKHPRQWGTWSGLVCVGALFSSLGSFCVLNPEGCPPRSSPPPPAQLKPVEDLESPANKQACLDACEAGGEVLKNFCRRLRNERKKALCWGAAEGTKPAGACVTRAMSVMARLTALRARDSEEVS